MDLWEKGIEILKKIPKDYYLPIGVGCIGLILFGYGLYITIYKPQARENSSQNTFSQTAGQNSAILPVSSSIKVDVEGAIANPGVYTVASDARVQDGLVAAGGLSGNADRNWVSQHINLALKLTDGIKIYVPSAGEVAGNSSSNNTQTAPADVLGAQNQQIDINSASESDLDSLPGIGQVTAQKIIAGRPYSTIEDLETRKIVGVKEFEKIKDLIITQ